MSNPGEDLFVDFRNFRRDPTEYGVYDLGSGYRVQTPGKSGIFVISEVIPNLTEDDL